MRENLRSAQFGTQSNVDLVYPGLQPTYVTYPGADPYMGYLYTWYSAVGLPEGSTANPPTAISERVQGICPNEWAIPSAAQLEALLASGETRTETQSYWSFNTGTIPTGSNGFLMVPSGFYNNQFNQFAEYNHVGYIWTLNYNGNNATCGIFPFDCRPTASMSLNKNSLLSVRCVKAPPYGIEEITACDSITWNGVTRYTSGRYVANLPNDSVSTLLLTVNYTTRETVKLVACDSYYWNLTEQTYTTSGVHQATITNYLGCDSVVTLDLEVRYSNTGVDVQNHCDSYTWIDGITYTESTNTPTFVVTNAAGCDSTVTLNLTIRKMTTGIDVQNHCDSYTWIDGITYTESTNTPTFTLTNAVGCDSVVTLNLTIRNKTYGIDVQDHCDSYTWINGVTYTESTNEPVYTITNNAGCDSIVTLNLTIRKKTASPSQSLTEYNTYTWNGTTYTTSGVYTATLTNAVGCDSTATLDLTILYRFPITYNVNGGVMPAEYPINYIQGVGATLPIPTKANNRFDGWYDNASFTGSPITAVSNSESGDKQYWALWTVLEISFNSSISLSGSSSSYVQIPDATELNPTTAITLEAWIFPTAWRTNVYEGSIITKEQSTGSKGYAFRCGAGGKLSFAFGNGTGFPEIVTTNAVLTLNEWQHVAVTYDGTTMKLFRNGVVVETKAQTGNIEVSTNPVEIGRNPQYTDRYFTGRIDETRIFNVALDAATIQSWYNKSLNNTHANHANLVGYYEFDNTTNSTNAVGTVGANGIITSASYLSNCSIPFITSSTFIGAPSSVMAIHPIPSHLTAMMPVVPGDTLAQILQINIQSAIGGNITQIVLSTNGTTNPADITNARLWYTGTTANLSTATLFGTPILNPNGTMIFNGNVPTNCGSTYYFFLTYDIKSSAIYNNVIDAEVVNCTVERLLITPSSSAPVGNRLIADPCKFQILQISDTYGDGWNNGTITVYKNSTAIYTNITITASTLAIFEYPILSNIGDTIKIITTTAGSYPGEMRVQLLDGRKNPIIAYVQPPLTPGISAITGCYTNISTSISSNGTITPAAGFIPTIIGTSKSFIYKPSANYYTDSVIVNGVNLIPYTLDTIYTFTNVTTPQTLRVTFKTNTITASTGSNGTISPSGSVSVGKNGSQKFTFVPSTNCWLDSLIVDGINRPDSIPGKSYTFINVNEPHTIRSVYNANIITATAGSNGTISSSGATVMAPNSSKTYTMTPSTNYFLDSLIVDGINRPDSIPNQRFTFNNVNEDHTIRVVFRTITIISSTGPNGTVSPLGTTNKLPGSSQKYTITPNQYYFLDSLIVNGVNVPDSIAGKSYTFNNINANQTIRVVFKTNYLTPVLITPPTVVGTPVQDAALSTTTLTGGLVQYNSINVPGTFVWTAPSSLFSVPGNYNVTFIPTDTNTYFRINGTTFVNFNISYFISANGTTTNSYLPYYGLYMDDPQNSFVLYPDTMLTPLIGKTITQLTFYHSSTTVFNYTSISTINLGPTSLTELPSSGAPAYTPTTVFVGALTRNANGTVTITLNTPYLYTGGNLMFNFVNPDGGNFSSASFYGVARTNCGRYNYNSTTTRVNFVPKVKFNVAP